MIGDRIIKVIKPLLLLLLLPLLLLFLMLLFPMAGLIMLTVTGHGQMVKVSSCLVIC